MAPECLEVPQRDVEIHNAQAIGDSSKSEDRFPHCAVLQLLTATSTERFELVVDKPGEGDSNLYIVGVGDRPRANFPDKVNVEDDWVKISKWTGIGMDKEIVGPHPAALSPWRLPNSRQQRAIHLIGAAVSAIEVRSRVYVRQDIGPRAPCSAPAATSPELVGLVAAGGRFGASA